MALVVLVLKTQVCCWGYPSLQIQDRRTHGMSRALPKDGSGPLPAKKKTTHLKLIPPSFDSSLELWKISRPADITQKPVCHRTRSDQVSQHQHIVPVINRIGFRDGRGGGGIILQLERDNQGVIYEQLKPLSLNPKPKQRDQHVYRAPGGQRS